MAMDPSGFREDLKTVELIPVWQEGMPQGSSAYYKVCGRPEPRPMPRRQGEENMKKGLLKGFTTLMLIVVLALTTAIASAKAQSANRVVADIPFEFSVGYKTMPAGEYSVRTVTTAGDGLMIQSADGKSSALRLSEATERAKDKSHARLVFHKYGERYFLAEVWNGADRSGRQLLESQEERAIERELASISPASATAKNTYETVEVMASIR
jgi:hypothetical protein